MRRKKYLLAALRVILDPLQKQKEEEGREGERKRERERGGRE